MARRSNFPRFDKDCYDTIDPRAVRTLLPHLASGSSYVEPCAGRGALIKQLEGHLVLKGAYDIEPRAPGIEHADALTVTLGDADMFCTNPPWTRDLLHELIMHFSDQGATWLLFDSSWANTKQAGRFMERCRKIVAVGRLKWIPDSKMSGKDDAAWYLFGHPIPRSAPLHYGIGCLPPDGRARGRRCADCGHVIDRFGKWKLQPRQGVMTPVHLFCDRPSSRFAPGQETLAPTPLFDTLDEAS